MVVPLCGPGRHTHGGVACASRGKRPLVGGWQRRRVPLSCAEIERHWPGSGADAGRNVGIVCDGLLVIDCDTRNGVDDPATLALLFEGPLRQPAGCGGGDRRRRSALLLPDARRLRGGGETRREGSVPVSMSRPVGAWLSRPPSLHESGKRYWWLTGDGGVGMGEALPPGVS